MHVTVILPALNEAALISTALERLKAQFPAAEVLVVDGGSRDGTRELAEPQGTVLPSPPGRARQLNLGAREARGEWLLFLHVDTRLPDGWQTALEEAGRRGCAAGVFRLRIVGRHPLLPLLSLGANLRTNLRRIFLGDQALFIRKALFMELGGFPELPLLEDYAFARLLKRRGVPLHVSRLRVETSGRRWDVHGFFRTWWLFRRIYLRYHLFGDARGTASEYDHIRQAGWMDTVHLILFTRAPVPGQTKTRLAAALGGEAAKDLHVCCLRDLIETCERFRDEWRKSREESKEVQLHLFITPPGSESVFAKESVGWGDHVQVHGQTGQTLAERMANAFAEVLREAPAEARALLIGADIPLVDGRHLRQALAALIDADAVFGGTDDGGYYLVGTRGLIPRVFQLKRWKEGEVLSDSLALGGARGFSTALIDTLPDVDTVEDLRRVRAHPLFSELSGRRAVQFIANLEQLQT